MFHIGQLFSNDYPPEAAVWCNENNAYIDEVSENLFEIKAIPEPTEAELAESEISSLKAELTSYDYIGTKIAMGVATREDYATEIAYTEELRKKINELEPITLGVKND